MMVVMLLSSQVIYKKVVLSVVASELKSVVASERLTAVDIVWNVFDGLKTIQKLAPLICESLGM